MTVKRKINNVTSVTLVNATVKTLDLTPGTDKRWQLLSMIMTNPDDVDRGLRHYHYLEAGATNLLQTFFPTTTTVAGSAVSLPGRFANSNDARNSWYATQYVEGGEILRFQWASGGASTGGTDADGMNCQVLEEAL